MRSQFPLVIIGAGPAGAGAAKEAVRCVIDCALIDQDRIDGDQLGAERTDILEHAAVWNIEANADGGFTIGILHADRSRDIHADHLIIANGAYAREVPFLGWHLPGVEAAVAKPSIPTGGEGIVLAGSGPTLFANALSYLRAGADVRALLDTRPTNRLDAIIEQARSSPEKDYLDAQNAMVDEVRSSGVSVYAGVSELQASGDASCQAIAFTHAGQRQSIEARSLVLDNGLVPDTRMAQVAGCELAWSASQQCWHPILDSYCRNVQSGAFVAGAAAGIVDARVAELQGELCTLAVAGLIGAISTGEHSSRLSRVQESLSKRVGMQSFHDALYQSPIDVSNLDDATIVCRCESVTAGEIRAAARLGCPGVNQVKAFTRCGMGPCQGRDCGLIAAALIAQVRGESIESAGYFRARPPLVPINLGQLADCVDPHNCTFP
ncbi:MAG: NAD(P)/FAD-dependent oxidoreductase [Pseudomonadota bacterium]